MLAKVAKAHQYEIVVEFPKFTLYTIHTFLWMKLRIAKSFLEGLIITRHNSFIIFRW